MTLIIRNFGPMFRQRFGSSFSCLAVVGLPMTTYSYAAQLRSQRRLDFELYRRVPQTSDRNMSRELVNKFYELKKVDEKQRFDELMKALREYSQDKDDEKKRLDTLREALHGLDELDKEEKNEESAPHAHPHLSDRRSELQRVLCDGLSDSECKKRRDELREALQLQSQELEMRPLLQPQPKKPTQLVPLRRQSDLPHLGNPPALPNDE